MLRGCVRRFSGRLKAASWRAIGVRSNKAQACGLGQARGFGRYGVSLITPLQRQAGTRFFALRVLQCVGAAVQVLPRWA